MSGRVKMFPRWYKQLKDLSPDVRKKLVEAILHAVSCHGSLEDKPTQAGKELVYWIKSEFDLVGFAPNFTYLKAEAKKQEDLEASWIHPWGFETLVYKHKKFPFLIFVNSKMRKDQMFLQEIPFNEDAIEKIVTTGVVG